MGMARLATTADIFSAIAEPRRRQILELLARGAMSVTALVEALRLPQPAVSKHLGVLRRVGAVAAVRRGRERLYRLNAAELRAVHEWTGTFERHWESQLERIRTRAERAAPERPRTQPKEPSP